MSAQPAHNGLSSDQRKDIRRTVLDARELIEDDLQRELERYGLYEDEWLDIEDLGHLDAYDLEVRREVDAALQRELEATDGIHGRSLQNYIREATKTYLNRLVALKALEARGLITETLRTRPEFGDRSQLHRTIDEVAGEVCDVKDGGIGATLDVAYTELGDEIGVIFDESEYTAVDIDFKVRQDVIDLLNDIDDEVWKSDEAMGWVYQYFGEKEREEIDDRIDEENYKVADTDVATKTQLFTPRYIVEWMVDNSLGRLWLEMHGDDTNIDDEDKCFYLAPLEESLIDREPKDVREIKVLDPACGSGHMLFYAFDVLYEMYLEQGDIQEKYIPREILENNLYGIDIDEGAAQIAAISLYVKAKSRSPEIPLKRLNILSANAVLVNGEKKEEVLKNSNTDIERRVLERVWTNFEHIREWGSLVRIKEHIEDIIDDELGEIESTGQSQFTNDGKLAKQSSVVSFSGSEESWDHIKDRLLEQASTLAKEALDRNDPLEELFAGEVHKSVQIADVLSSNYDAIVSNPPYLYQDKMNDELKGFVKDNYLGNRDLYGAFIERCLELSKEEGYVSMVTMENFMFLYSFRTLRPYILDQANITEAAHLEHRDEGHMNIPFVLRKGGVKREARFLRLVEGPEKKEELTKLYNAIRNGEDKNEIYVLDQDSFEEIERTPFIYWFGDEVLKLFVEEDPLKEFADVMEGLTTGDDDLFLRNWWEVNDPSDGRYRWVAKSGDGEMYYESHEQLIKWVDDGEEIKQHDGSHIRNEKFHGNHGVTFRDFAKYFTARVHNSGDMFSNKAHFVYSGDKRQDYYILGYMCSSLSRFIMNGLNPGLNFKSGDGARLPIKMDIETKEDVIDLTKTAIDSQKQLMKVKETKKEFDPETLLNTYPNTQYYIEEKKSDVLVLHGLIDSLIFDGYDISSKTRERVYNELPKNLSMYPHIGDCGGSNSAVITNSEVKIETVAESDKSEYAEKISPSEGIRSQSESLEVLPHTVANLRREYDIYDNNVRKSTAGRILSYFLGEVFGRWENLQEVTTIADGILVFDDQFDNNVTDRIRECLEATFDDIYEKEAEIEELLNKDMTDWLRENFFRYHHCKEYRRRGQRIPIYWHLESDEGAFSCFVYYHAMDADTFPKLRGQYVDEKITSLRNRLDVIESQLDSAEGDEARDLRSEKEDVEDQLDDLNDFRDRLDALIAEGFEPDFEAGIWENIQRVDEHDLLAVPLDKL